MKTHHINIIHATAAALLLSTAAHAVNTNRLVWPPSPETPRIAYVQSITGPADIGIRPSFWRRIASVFTGETHRNLITKPLGIALDDAGNLLLTDTSANIACYFDFAQHRFERWEKIGPYRLVSPVALTRHRETFYLADPALHAILAFDIKGKLSHVITNGLHRPAALAWVGEKLFVADAGAHQIAIFDPQGNRLGQFGKRGVNPGEFNYPSHLAADNAGRLFITDSMNSRVQILDAATGRFISAFGSYGDGPGYFSRPKGVAVDNAGHVYVADAVFDNVQIYDQQGRLLLHFGSAGQKPGEFWLPTGIAIGKDNRIYIADSYNKRIQVFQYLEAP
jgi:DNA-binding beta-propeller fold protein YncE